MDEAQEIRIRGCGLERKRLHGYIGEESGFYSLYTEAMQWSNKII